MEVYMEVVYGGVYGGVWWCMVCIWCVWCVHVICVDIFSPFATYPHSHIHFLFRFFGLENVLDFIKKNIDLVYFDNYSLNNLRFFFLLNDNKHLFCVS